MLSLAAALAILAAGPVSTDIALPAQPAPLHGTLLTPPDASAAAVILPGSGPTDRDGNSPMGVAAGTYRLLADTRRAWALLQLEDVADAVHSPTDEFRDLLAQLIHDAFALLS